MTKFRLVPVPWFRHADKVTCLYRLKLCHPDRSGGICSCSPPPLVFRHSPDLLSGLRAK
jgi:hypothetical protein